MIYDFFQIQHVPGVVYDPCGFKHGFSVVDFFYFLYVVFCFLIDKKTDNVVIYFSTGIRRFILEIFLYILSLVSQSTSRMKNI
jgi:hypothetical protein